MSDPREAMTRLADEGPVRGADAVLRDAGSALDHGSVPTPRTHARGRFVLLAAVVVLALGSGSAVLVLRDSNDTHISSGSHSSPPTTMSTAPPVPTTSPVAPTAPEGTMTPAMTTPVASETPRPATPTNCADFDSPTIAPTATSVEALSSAMVGTWVGCITTPWTSTYLVRLTFNADGTYDSEALEVPVFVVTGTPDAGTPGLYYGADGPDPRKRWAVSDVGETGAGSGTIVIAFTPGATVTNRLNDIRLTNDRLSFEFLHLDSYGLLRLHLVRQ